MYVISLEIYMFTPSTNMTGESLKECIKKKKKTVRTIKYIISTGPVRGLK